MVPAHRVLRSFCGGSIGSIGHILVDVEKASERDMLEKVCSDDDDILLGHQSDFLSHQQPSLP